MNALKPEDSYWEATASPAIEKECLDGSTAADVCVVGGGYTGLSAALHLAKAGASVVLMVTGISSAKPHYSMIGVIPPPPRR